MQHSALSQKFQCYARVKEIFNCIEILCTQENKLYVYVCLCVYIYHFRVFNLKATEHFLSMCLLSFSFYTKKHLFNNPCMHSCNMENNYGDPKINLNSYCIGYYSKCIFLNNMYVYILSPRLDKISSEFYYTFIPTVGKYSRWLIPPDKNDKPRQITPIFIDRTFSYRFLVFLLQ